MCGKTQADAAHGCAQDAQRLAQHTQRRLTTPSGMEEEGSDTEGLGCSAQVKAKLENNKDFDFSSSFSTTK